ncbi:MAG: hypothetical protein ABIK65_02520 [Candidatus Eisenbacteria bacterium]
MEEFQECPHCGRRTPEENLRCIYCGELLPVRRGAIGSLRFGGGRGVFVLLAAFLALFILWLWFR